VTRPVVGVTIAYDQRRAGVYSLRQDYVRSVERAGAVPLVLAPVVAELVPELLARVQGLVLTGGTDLDPTLYGEQPDPKLGEVFRERDDFELELTRQALARDLPLLAICRGCQVLNVATGGTLVQDIASHVAGAADHDPERERWETTHDVRLLPGTLLARLLETDRVAVNSFHHQAVKELGHGLVVSARSAADDVVEAIEAPGRRFTLGIQWHPEGFWNQGGNFQVLFDALSGEARA